MRVGGQTTASVSDQAILFLSRLTTLGKNSGTIPTLNIKEQNSNNEMCVNILSNISR